MFLCTAEMAKGTSHNTKMTYAVRPMVYSDLPQVWQLEQLVFPDPWSFQSFKESLKDERVDAWVTESGNQIIGYMVTLCFADEIHILNFAVDTQCRRKGIGTAMMSTLHRYAERCGSSHMWLEVRSTNEAAQDFYRYHGFNPLGTKKRYYQNGEEAVIMAKALHE